MAALSWKDPFFCQKRTEQRLGWGFDGGLLHRRGIGRGDLLLVCRNLRRLKAGGAVLRFLAGIGCVCHGFGLCL